MGNDLLMVIERTSRKGMNIRAALTLRIE